jgi:hypothetical protein
VVLPTLPSLTQFRVIFPTLKGSGTMMQIAELKLYGSQSSTPAKTFALSTQSESLAMVAKSSDSLIAFGQEGRSAAPPDPLVLDPQADGIIHEKGLVPGRETSWPTRPIPPQKRHAFPVGLLPASNPVPLTVMETIFDQHHLPKNVFPLLASPGNPFLQG